MAPVAHFNSRALRELGFRVLAAGLLLSGLALIQGCSLSNDVGNGLQAPLNVLPESDVVVETNLSTAQTAAQAGGLTGSSVATTSGPSTGYSVISVSSGPGRPAIYAGFNQLSNDCLGLMVVPAGSLPALGEGLAGTYYFWILKTTSAACDAATFARTPSLPSSWPKNDPSSGGWPKPS